jgi:hypothetical protein
MHKVRNFHEGHGTVGEWQDRSTGPAGEQHGNGMVCVNWPLVAVCTVCGQSGFEYSDMTPT